MAKIPHYKEPTEDRAMKIYELAGGDPEDITSLTVEGPLMVVLWADEVHTRTCPKGLMDRVCELLQLDVIHNSVDK